MNSKHVGVGVIVLIVVAGLSFWGGMSYAKSQTSARGAFAGFTGSAGNFRMRGAGGGFTAGQIVSVDGGSLTLSTQDGGSKVIYFATSTQIMKTAAGSPSDLMTGENVVIMGTANADGSVTAQSIQLRPAGAGRQSQ